MKLHPFSAFAVILAVALAGCSTPASDTPIVEDAEEDVLERTVRLPARGGYEANLDMTAEASFALQFNSTGELAWDIHSHNETGGVQTWRQGSGKLGEASFTAPSAGVYSAYWQNKNAFPVELSYNIRGSFTVKSLS